MVINTSTKQVQTQSSHPHDNWMGEGWEVVPYELESKAMSLSPFMVILRNEAGEIVDFEADTAAREAWEVKMAAMEAEDVFSS